MEGITQSYRLQVYVSKEDLPTIEKLKVIAKRESKSLSGVIMEILKRGTRN